MDRLFQAICFLVKESIALFFAWLGMVFLFPLMAGLDVINDFFNILYDRKDDLEEDNEITRI